MRMERSVSVAGERNGTEHGIPQTQLQCKYNSGPTPPTSCAISITFLTARPFQLVHQWFYFCFVFYYLSSSSRPGLCEQFFSSLLLRTFLVLITFSSTPTHPPAAPWIIIRCPRRPPPLKRCKLNHEYQTGYKFESISFLHIPEPFFFGFTFGILNCCYCCCFVPLWTDCKSIKRSRWNCFLKRRRQETRWR